MKQFSFADRVNGIMLSYKEFQKMAKKSASCVPTEFNSVIKSLDDLRGLKKGCVAIRPPNSVELEKDETENVPTEIPETGYWSIRVRSALPVQYVNLAWLNVSLLLCSTLLVTMNINFYLLVELGFYSL